MATLTSPNSMAPVPTKQTPKPFKCNFCSRQFSRREHLQRHHNIHYNRKPYHCALCNYSCRRSDLLSRHTKLAHANREDSNVSPDKSKSAQPPVLESSPVNPGPSQGQLCTSQTFEQPVELQSLTDMTIPETTVPHLPRQSIALQYLDGVSLPPSRDQSFFYPELSLSDPFLLSPVDFDPVSVDTADIQTVHENLLAPTDGMSRLVSPSPGLSDPSRSNMRFSQFLRVSEDDWLWLSSEISQFSAVLPERYMLPSRHALSRYFHGFLNGFHPHFPILHPQTLSLRKMTPELILALAAVGSQYCLESHQGLAILELARPIALEQLRRRESLPAPTPSESTGHDRNTDDLLQTIQALFYMMAMSTWGGIIKSLVRQALATQSLLAVLVRQHGLDEPPASPSTWEDWARMESARRTKLTIFCFFNLHTITFNTPSPLMIADIDLRLPCTELEWKAPGPDEWAETVQKSDTPPLFRDCMTELLRDPGAMPVCSSLGSHILIHALIQHIFSIRQTMQPGSANNEIPPEFSAPLRRALKKWQQQWEQNPESSLSPLDKHGPIAFNSTALFHLAYIRLVVDIGAVRSLLEQDHVRIAERLAHLPDLPRGSALTLAARHAIAALCPPVQMGVYSVARAPSWSVMHAVCSLEYAFLLSKFINITENVDRANPLEASEQAVLAAIKETLREVESSMPEGDPTVIDTAPNLLGAKAVRSWGLILEGMRTWNAVDLISKTLFQYADSLQ